MPQAAADARGTAQVVVVPIRSFTDSKQRLAATLDAPARHSLSVELATAVLDAARHHERVVVTNDEDAAALALRHGAAVLADPGTLDGAAAAGRDWARKRGAARVVVIHADLPFVHSIDALLRPPGARVAVLVADHRSDGTPALSVPTDSAFEFAYGPGSFERHRNNATAAGLAVEIERDPALAFDVDLPEDLAEMNTRKARFEMPTPARALAIGAHPDDVEFGCGATLAKWAEAGGETHLLVLTDGSKGSWDASRDRAELVATREREQAVAAHRLGVTAVHHLRHVDGELDSDLSTRAEVCRVIREVRPDVILGHDPWKRYRIHPDHRHAGLLAVEGIVAARDPHFFAEQRLAPHRPDVVLLFEPDEVDHVEVVESRHVDARIAALLAHTSQWESTMHISVGQHDSANEQRRRFEDGQRRECAEAGARVGARFGEAFKRLTDL